MRAEAKRVWVASVLGHAAEIRPLAGDASFRSYDRVHLVDKTWVLMDAPPGKEDVRPFLRVREWLEARGVRVPHLLASDEEQGFLLLEDFGDVSWAAHAKAGGALESLFHDAIRQLHALQEDEPDFALPVFDMARMRTECDLYLDWYLPRVAGYTPSEDERTTFHDALTPVLEEIAGLPRVPVHLDYHSRNLMMPEGGLPLGVIDFQDAVIGPVTYDIASLLYDCYQDYPETERRRWSKEFFEQLRPELAGAFDGFEDWHRHVRLTALQRHIKAIGIFARLAYRDGKRQFINEIPLTRKHLRDELQVLELEAHPLLRMERA